MAGAGYKLFNTGDVLTAAQVNTYLMEQTVMVFANAAARTTALSGVVSEGMISYLKDTNAVEVYDGSNWVSSDDPNAIQNTIVDAKGDLITATAADTPSRIAVGNNGETLVADSSATTGLRWQGNFAAGKNKIINGDFQIWQRGTSFSNPADSTYTSDRWIVEHDGTGATRTISQQTFTPGTAPVSGYEGQYFYRYAVSAAGTGNTFNDFSQRIEDVRNFAGQVVTLSFWAKAASNLSLETLSRQTFGSGGSTGVQASIGSVSVTTSWQRFTQTYTVNSVSGKTIGAGSFLQIRFRPPANSTFTLDIWGVQLEASNTATAFQTATGTLAGELAACQRYYQRIGSPNGTRYQYFTNAYPANSTTAVYPVYFYPVQMRVAPTALDYSSLTNLNLRDGTTFYTPTSLALDASTNVNSATFAVNVASGLTQYRPYNLMDNNTAGTSYIGLSAEL